MLLKLCRGFPLKGDPEVLDVKIFFQGNPLYNIDLLNILSYHLLKKEVIQLMIQTNVFY